MKRKLTYIALFVMVWLSAAVSAGAQHNVYKGDISFGPATAIHQGGMMVIDVDVDLSKLTLHKQQMLMLTPMLRLRDAGDSQTYIFSPIAINGKTRYEVLRRSMRYNNINFEYEPGQVVKRNNKKEQVLPLSLTLPFEQWMLHAELVFIEEVTGCTNCHVAYNEHVVAVGEPVPGKPVPSEPLVAVTPPKTVGVPNFVLSMIVPPVESVKERTETFSATIHFPVSSSAINRNFKNNAKSLQQIDDNVNMLKNNPDLTVTDIRVTGYASPEGYFQSNLELSKKRSMALVTYLNQRHGFKSDAIDFYWRGEDWDGLRKAVEESNMADKHEVLNIIDNTRDVNQRKARLRAISQGQTYQYLLRSYFPEFRRNDYTVTYIARPFSVDEARELIDTKPRQLSMNEMFMLAVSYETGSKEFKHVFDMAARHFPLDRVSNVNAGAVDIDNGAYDAGIERLVNWDCPESWNNIGVAYAMKGDYNKAETYFRRAANAGDTNAKNNLDQLLRWSGK